MLNDDGRPSVDLLDFNPVLTGNKGAPLSASLGHKQAWAYAFLF